MGQNHNILFCPRSPVNFFKLVLAICKCARIFGQTVQCISGQKVRKNRIDYVLIDEFLEQVKVMFIFIDNIKKGRLVHVPT